MKEISMKAIITLLILITCGRLSAQQAVLKGKITTSDNKPAEHVSVLLQGKSYGATSDEKGEYRITHIKPGAYTLKATAVGLEPQIKSINLYPGQTLTVNFVLAENFARLQEVVISTQKPNPLYVKKSENVARMSLQNLENPQVYTTITQDLLKMQVVTNFSDAIKNAPGLDKLWTSTGRSGDGAAYYNLRGFITQPSFVNGVAGLTNGDLDPANIEKIEVIKGPSGTLFGGALTNFGGLINIVTKRPADTLGGEFNYTAGSFNLNRLSGDMYGPISRNQKLTGRLNASYHNQNSFQDMGFRKSFFIAPALQYDVNERLTLNLDVQFYSYEGTNPLMVFLNRSRQLQARRPEELNFNFNRSYTSNDLTIKTPSSNFMGKIDYKISDSWSSQTNFSRSNRKSDGFYQYVMYIGATDDILNRYINIQNSLSTSLNLQQNFTGEFNLAGLRNRLVIGADYLQLGTVNNNSPYILFDQVNASQDDPNYAKINRTKVEAAIAASSSPYTRNTLKDNVYGVYASDVLNLSDRLMAMLSLRADRFEAKDSYKQTALSPKFGLVYQPVKDKISLFANYMNGFRNVAPVVQPLPDISGTFKPQQANQLEGGVKLDILKNRLSLTASYYDISVSNMTRSESLTRDGVTYLITVQDGTQESKGLELDMISNPARGLNIIAGFSYNDSKITKAAPSVEGRRPVTAGPETLVNVWANYTVPTGKLKGFGLGFGGNYASENIITNTSVTGQFILPSYTVLNASLFYNCKSYYIGLKADNLTDKTYFKGWTTVEPQMPGSFLASITYKF